MREARKALRGHSNGDGRGGRGCKMGVGAETWLVMVLVIQLSGCWTVMAVEWMGSAMMSTFILSSLGRASLSSRIDCRCSPPICSCWTSSGTLGRMASR